MAGDNEHLRNFATGCNRWVIALGVATMVTMVADVDRVPARAIGGWHPDRAIDTGVSFAGINGVGNTHSGLTLGMEMSLGSQRRTFGGQGIRPAERLVGLQLEAGQFNLLEVHAGGNLESFGLHLRGGIRIGGPAFEEPIFPGLQFKE